MTLRRDGAEQRCQTASEKREAVTGQRDRLAEERNRAELVSSSELGGALRDRESAARDRRKGSLDRRQAAEDRRDAARQQAQAGTDGLTGTLRRERGMLQLQQAIDRVGVDGHLVLAFVDVDGLKRINDTLGHAAGDQLLSDTGDALKPTCGQRT